MICYSICCFSRISLSLELNDTMPKLGLILLIKEIKAKRG